MPTSPAANPACATPLDVDALQRTCARIRSENHDLLREFKALDSICAEHESFRTPQWNAMLAMFLPLAENAVTSCRMIDEHCITLLHHLGCKKVPS